MPGQGDYPLLSSWLTRRGRGRGRLLYDASPLSGTGQNLKTAWNDWFFEPAAGGGLTLTFTGVLSDSDTLYAPAVGLNLLPNLFSDGDTLYAPAVSAGGGVSATQPLQKPTAVLRIAVSRNVRDIYLNRRFKVEARYPGGRTILKAKVATRGRAFAAALRAAAPQTSATAAGGSGSYTSNPQGASGSIWQRNPEQAIVNEP